MEELAEIMRLHAEKYPGMKPQDCIKLLYQNTKDCCLAAK